MARHQTVGGAWGHWFRRLIHISTFIIPVLYYALAILRVVVVVALVLVALAEVIRLIFGWTVVGQRPHEAQQLSSFAWSALSIGVVLLWAPAYIGVPVIWGCAFGDPLLGELRARGVPKWLTFFGGVLLLLAIWWFAMWLYGTPWWWALILSPLTVLVEWPNLRWIDDNALMILVPFFTAMLLL